MSDQKQKKLGLKLKSTDVLNKNNYQTSKIGSVAVEIKKSAKGEEVNEESVIDKDLEKRISIVKEAQKNKSIADAREIREKAQDEQVEQKLEAKKEKVEKVAPPIPPTIPVIQGKKTASFDKVNGKNNKKSSEEVKKKANPVVAPPPKKLQKTDILNIIAKNQDNTIREVNFKPKKIKKAAKSKGSYQKIYRDISIPDQVIVGDFANLLTEKPKTVIQELSKLGVKVKVNDTIDYDTAEIVSTSLGHTVTKQEKTTINSLIDGIVAGDNQQKTRPPVVVVMGHVDHGKTSILDALKQTDITSGEAGGITQHIGAYQVELSNKEKITFIDTPGHEAFTEMRVRGAKITDIVVLVVAIDDGINTQTIEAINHAKAAKVPIIVAVNKIDKFPQYEAELSKVKNMFLNYELIPEDMGGDVIFVPVSALKKTNLDKLEESILLLAEMLELKANYGGHATGYVIESKIVKGQGISATLLVQQGKLKHGDIVLTEKSYGKIKRMMNDKSKVVKEAGPSTPIEVLGLNDLPKAGDKFLVVESEKVAKEVIENIQEVDTEEEATSAVNLDDLFKEKKKELSIILKCDVHGSIEAISQSLNSISNEEVDIKIIHANIGDISESDVMLAQTVKENSMIIGFNVKSTPKAKELAKNNTIQIKFYDIIYNIIDDMKLFVTGMMDNVFKEQYLGTAEIRQIFNITKIGAIAGSYIKKGVIKRNACLRLIRNNETIYEGTIKTLKRIKNDVEEVREGYECGIAIKNYDKIEVGDIIEVFEKVQENI